MKGEKMYHSRFKGSHYSVGYKYGSLLKKHNHKINSCPTFKIDNERIEFSKKCIEEYKKYYPEILDEIKGIADGNETSYEFLTALLLSMY
jgi:predicted choloylglycine hydrolase